MQFSAITIILALTSSVFATAAVEKRSPSGTCPVITDTSPTTFLADDSDCNVFYICDHSGPVKFNCPAGLHFSPTNWICDWPNHAGCKSY
ncbi:hypothetical protein K440DRAFT_610516 [Wilcoxina mikolae CBS 423.85]|nr:hypothetical protein K440DRAFT_610516 [Wilcoxina mikolae CBS 423.85]